MNRTDIGKQLSGFVGRDIDSQFVRPRRRLYAEGDTVAEELVTKTFENGKTWTWNPAKESEPDPATGRTKKYDEEGKLFETGLSISNQLGKVGGTNLFGQATLVQPDKEATGQKVPVSVSIAVEDYGDPVDKPYSGYTGPKNVDDLFNRMTQTKIMKQVPIIGSAVKLADFVQGGERGAIDRFVRDAGYGAKDKDSGQTAAELISKKYTGKKEDRTEEEKEADRKKEEEKNILEKGADFLGKLITGGFGDTSIRKGEKEKAKAHLANLMANQPAIGDQSRRAEEGYNLASTYGIKGAIPTMDYTPNYDVKGQVAFFDPDQYTGVEASGLDYSQTGSPEAGQDIFGMTAAEYGFDEGDWGVGEDSLIASGGAIPFAHGGGLSSIGNQHLEPGSFVLAADVVSGAGDGDTQSGLKLLHDELGIPIAPSGTQESSTGGPISGSIRGPGSGLDDMNQTSIDGRIPAALSNGETVLARGSVARIAHLLHPDKKMTSNEALKLGQEGLFNLQKNIRKQKAGTSKGGKQPGPLKTGRGGLLDLMRA